ncbi:unnamed protein product [Rhodiola kirilowii]
MWTNWNKIQAGIGGNRYHLGMLPISAFFSGRSWRSSLSACFFMDIYWKYENRSTCESIESCTPHEHLRHQKLIMKSQCNTLLIASALHGFLLGVVLGHEADCAGSEGLHRDHLHPSNVDIAEEGAGGHVAEAEDTGIRRTGIIKIPVPLIPAFDVYVKLVWILFQLIHIANRETSRKENRIGEDEGAPNMLRLQRLIHKASSAGHEIITTPKSAPANTGFLHPRYRVPAQTMSVRFLDIYQMGSKEAIEKERARLKDEMNRGYFADINELKEHGGKIATAGKVLIPAAVAVKFPVLEANYPDGTSVRLPVGSEANVADAHNASAAKASLICFSFRANSQPMVASWSLPFLDAFGKSEDLQIYEVSFIESWLLSLKPVKSLLLRTMKKSNPDASKGPLTRQLVYSFGDQYYLRKELKILNLLTGYAFLLDKFGRIRWQGFGFATPDEVSSLVSCTSLLLDEK